jgi:pimeloyl-ACP methyl ester carboxylesterase
MSWFALQRGPALLQGWDGGHGLPVIFQHGLGGDEAQVAEVFPDAPGIRRLTVECRGQGRSDAGDPAGFSIANFSDDVLAFADSRGIDRFVVGGISMGAAIALRIAVRHPDRVSALIIARPAWVREAAPVNMQPFAEVAAYLQRPDPVRALSDYEQSPTAQRLAREAPDNLVSMRKFFSAEDRPTMAALLAAISADGPCLSEAEVRAIAMPVLVIGHGVDAVHPLASATRLAAMIGGAHFAEITPKASDRPRHVVEFRRCVTEFLAHISVSEGVAP